MPWRENEGKANNVKGSTPEDERFIYVYRLAIDAMTRKGDDVTGRKWPSLLEDFQTATTSVTRKRHHASTARGLYCFCLAPSIRKLIRSICLIRGRIQSKGQGTLHQAKDIFVAPAEPIFYCQRQLFCFVAFLSANGRPERWGGSDRQTCLHE